MHIVRNLVIVHRLALNIRLLSDDLKIAPFVTTKANHCEPCLREIGVVKRNAVEGKDGLDEIVESNGLDKRRAVVIYNGFTALSDLLTKTFG